MARRCWRYSVSMWESVLALQSALLKALAKPKCPKTASVHFETPIQHLAARKGLTLSVFEWVMATHWP